jgi:ectoine hydroxylase-related dioxygenase (phytanoyl-CoA dioxygenase family)
MRIQISSAEHDSGRLADESLSAAVSAFDEDGYVILGGAVDPAVLDAIKPKLDEDTAELQRRGAWGGAGRRVGHLQQSMPRDSEHIYGEIVTNPLVIQLTTAVLGEGIHSHFYNGNTNLPGSEAQPLHRDSGRPEVIDVAETVSIVINMSPVDVDETNGATEIWPGTHKLPGANGVSEEVEAARRAELPPVRAVTKKGDVVLRDIRLWHRGVPNLGDQARHMIGMIHSRPFFLSESSIRVPKSAAHAFDHPALTTRVEIVDDDYDYLSEPVST